MSVLKVVQVTEEQLEILISNVPVITSGDRHAYIPDDCEDDLQELGIDYCIIDNC